MASARLQLPLMSSNAQAIYAVLRTRVPPRGASVATITYGDLSRIVHIHYRSTAMDLALGEIVARCQARNLPLIAALVVRSDTGVPGAGYFFTAHGLAIVPRAASALIWAHDVVQVCAQRYPQRL